MYPSNRWPIGLLCVAMVAAACTGADPATDEVVTAVTVSEDAVGFESSAEYGESLAPDERLEEHHGHTLLSVSVEDGFDDVVTNTPAEIDIQIRGACPFFM